MESLFVLLQLVSSTLQAGDNPYEILGVSRSASDYEIKKAFREISLKYHPDINKDKDAEKIWIRASDAYDILANSKRRTLYDRTGSVSEQEHSTTKSSYHYTNRYESHPEPLKPTDVNDTQIYNLLAEKGEIFLQIYLHRPLFSNSNVFEIVASNFMKYVPFAKYKIVYNSPIAQMFNPKDQTILYLRKDIKGTITHKVFEFHHSTTDSVREFILSCWNVKIQIFTSTNRAFDWFYSPKMTKNRILIIDRMLIDDDFRYTVHKNNETIEFAILKRDLVKAAKKFRLTVFPAVLSRRGDSVSIESTPLVVRDRMDTLSFGDISDVTYNSVCNKFCVIRIGKPSEKEKKMAEQFEKYSILSVDISSKTTKILRAKDGEYIGLSIREKSIVHNLNASNFFSLRSQYKKGHKEPLPNLNEAIKEKITDFQMSAGLITANIIIVVSFAFIFKKII